VWGLSSEEQMMLLGLTSCSTLFNWRRDPEVSLSKDTLERISYVLGIYEALRI